MAYTAYSLVGFTTGAANTKGAYAQIVASTPYDSSRIHIIWASSSAARFLLADLATGGAGSEVVIASNLAIASETSDALLASMVSLGIQVPAGTRLSVRAQGVTAATLSNATFLLENRALAGLTNPVTYGSDTANSRGTQIDPGGTVNTKGAYVQLTASTTARIDLLALCVTTAAQGTAIAGTTEWRVDVATGAGGAEVVVLPDLQFYAGFQEDNVQPRIVQFPVSIPSGTRLAVRCQSSINTATVRLLCVTLIGMQEPATSAGATSVAYLG